MYVRLKTMATSAGSNQYSTHTERTSDILRNKVTSSATVTSRKKLSPTVKQFTLDVHNRELTFLAGQWLDLSIPGMKTIGGFSMCSGPLTLVLQHTLDLAVKYSEHPPARWLHTQCSVGSSVNIQVGGDFNLDLTIQGTRHLLLIAGGVGINPLFSMLLHALSNSVTCVQSVTLIYSARTVDEILFKDVLEDILRNHPTKVNIRLFVTRLSTGKETDLPGSSQMMPIYHGRITHDVIKNSICHCSDDVSTIHSYICGPSHMIDTMETYLRDCGMTQENIHYEKWW